MSVDSLSENADVILTRAAIIDWYRVNARTLPWRIPPGSTIRPDPYAVWLSEIMLQQTTVAAVRDYFERFTARWPTLADLAAADPADILAAWAGLGYYRRAHNLIACAGQAMRDHGGALPDTEAALRALPGIGDYTAAAIATIAFGRDAVPVDANIERVVARLFAITAPLPGGRRAIHDAARRLWPDQDGDGNGGDFAQALMDIGATVCTARNPSCAECPAQRHCAGLRLGVAASLPVKPAKAAKPHRHGRARWIERRIDGAAAVWLVRRPDRGLLGGMRALPGADWSTDPQPATNRVRTIGSVRHVFTHFTLTLAVDRSDDDAQTVGEGEWWPLSRLDEAGLPTLYRRAAALAMETDDD